LEKLRTARTILGESIQLRWYQQEAKQATYKYLETHTGSNPCVVIPTGGGKTPLLASICSDVAGQWGGRVLVLAHVKELLQQASEKLQSFLPHDMVGVYSAGLKSRDTDHPVICAGIQSVYKRAGELGPFSCIIVDEAHLIPTHDGGMYRTFIDSAKVVNPAVRIIGLTATPYRLDCGYICGQDNVLNDIAYEVGVKELIVQGFLSHVKTRAGTAHPDLDGVHIRGGEYIESEMAERMDAIAEAACEETVELTKDRKRVLVFCSGLSHARNVRGHLERLTGLEIGFVCGDTPAGERAELINRFKSGSLKYLVNMNVLTTGFDAPNIDAIALMRATQSPGLYYQMVGRGLRVCSGKEDCIVLDYGENTVRHGPIDAMNIDNKTGDGTGEAPAKECEDCLAVVPAGVARCPECGFEFPKPDPKYGCRAGKGGVLSGEVTTETLKVDRVSYFVHQKRSDPEAPTTMRVEYTTGFMEDSVKREWVCFNHSGWPRQKAEQWWRDRSLVPVPKSTEQAVELANAGALSETKSITWRMVSGEKYGNIVGYEVGDHKPTQNDIDVTVSVVDDEWGESSSNWFDEFSDEEIPF
jgi:DNA repair protein RadD